MKRSIIAVLTLGLIASATLAQAQAVEDVIVTGSRAIEWDPDNVPVVQLERRADNLIVEVQAVNDTRDAAQRRQELIQTLRGLARAAVASPDIDLSTEDDGVLVPLTEDMVTTLTLGVDPGRTDTSLATLIIKTSLRASDTLDAASGRIEAFVSAAQKTGRTLVTITGDWELSILNPPQYRTPILALMAEDARQTAAAFGPNYAVQVEGLSNRVTWRQSGPLDLALFIPYKLTVTPRP